MAEATPHTQQETTDAPTAADTEQQTVQETEPDIAWRDRLKSAGERLAPLLFLILISVFLSLTTDTFLTVQNILTVLLQISVIGIVAVGQTMVMITAGIDLSVGSVVGLSGVVSTLLMASFGWPVALAVLGGVAVGAAVGVVNGLLVTNVKIPPFIATLGMMSIARGAALVLTGGTAVHDVPSSFDWLGNGTVLGIPVPVLVLVLVVVVMGVVLRKTTLGRHAFAIGSNEETARMSGVSVSSELVKVYTLCAGLAGLGGVILSSRTVIGSPTAGQMYELDAIAACVIGGTSLFGGVGSVGGAVIGAGLMGLIRNGSNLLGVSSFWQRIVIGVIICIAVAWDQYRRRNA
jgi:ribose transport system permease protein